MATLNYEVPGRGDGPAVSWRWGLLLAGASVLLVTGFGQVLYEEFTGDPPSGRAFRAYHYMALFGSVAGMLWLGLLARWCWNRQWWWMIVVGAVWFGLMTYLSVANLIDVHSHPAGEYYWDLWWGRDPFAQAAHSYHQYRCAP